VAAARPEFTIGIEEEYLIVDRETRDLVRDLPDGLMHDCEEIIGGQVSPEFLRSQIEIGTKVCPDVAAAREDLARLRRAVAEVTGNYGLAPIAVSTHPFADWSEQQHTDRERYNELARALGGVVRRLLICGMHVHVGIEDEDLRIDLMGQITYFLPHLLALSGSSPFWQGNDTGLKSYRTAVFGALPRTGLPEEFLGWSDYQRHVEVLTSAGVIEDATKLWWDLRPSARYPTLEMRVADVCTRLDDAITVAALFVSMLSMLYRQRLGNRRWRTYSRMLIKENIWRAQRYGVEDSLIDFGKGRLVPFVELTDELIDLVRKDAEMLGCVADVERAARIAREGTSADRQREVFTSAVAAGGDEAEALTMVVDHLITETVAGT
jgi:carboxylate-amine ligase